jgi:2-polyprenyl-3-methyl-5-hydroxy-6-metoxy-1,4-benzoquinol methylase
MMPPEVQLENTACPLGCPPADETILVGRDRLHNLPGEFTVVKCRTCGLMRTDPRPTPETIGYYYPDDYGPYLGTRVDPTRVSSGPLPVWKRLAKKVFQFNTQRLPPLPPGRMLEVGCASGAFLHRMACQDWKVEGVEFSQEAAHSARSLGYSVYTGSIEGAPDLNHLYDLVVGWMVLEHVYDPLLALKKLHGWAKPGGWLAISVPNAAALEFRLFKGAWYALQLPNHLFHYTPQTLEMLLERAGWRMEKVFHQRILTNLVASLGHCLQDKKPRSKLLGYLANFPGRGVGGNLLLYPAAYVLSLFGQTGRMTVWAKRRE